MEKMIDVYGDGILFARPCDIVEVGYSSNNGDRVAGHYVFVSVKHNSGTIDNYCGRESQDECLKAIKMIAERINNSAKPLDKAK